MAKDFANSVDLVTIQEITGNTVVLKNGGLRQVVMVSGTNIALKSDVEQNIVIQAYQNLLNTLDFPIQIVVHSRKVNIEKYLGTLEGYREHETSPLLKNQIDEYREFIAGFVAKNPIMEKSFFVVVPFDSVSIPGASKGGLLGGILGKSKKTNPKADAAEEKTLNQHLSQLQQRTEQIISGLSQVGLRAVSLNDDETIELFYNLYNPEAVEKKGMDLFAEEKKPS